MHLSESGRGLFLQVPPLPYNHRWHLYRQFFNMMRTVLICHEGALLDQEVLARYVRAHRNLHRNPRDRGLYVLRCDIKSYGESIPVFPQSPLWARLEESFAATCGREISSHECALLAQCR